MFDSEKTNEKYEPQLTLLSTVSLFDNLKKEYEQSKEKLNENSDLDIVKTVTRLLNTSFIDKQEAQIIKVYFGSTSKYGENANIFLAAGLKKEFEAKYGVSWSEDGNTMYINTPVTSKIITELQYQNKLMGLKDSNFDYVKYKDNISMADYPELSGPVTKENTPIDQARAAEEKHDEIHTEFLRFTNDEKPEDRFKIYLVNGNIFVN
jgi:hypothetical protein